MKDKSVLVVGAVALLTVLAAVSGSIAVAQTDSSGDDPDISNYQVTSDGDEISVSFDSNETLVDIEVDVRGPDNGTLTEEDFDGNQVEGYEATYRAGEDGDYTLELVTARDSSNNEGADDGDYSDSASVQTSDNGTATASPTPTASSTPTASPTPTDDETPTDGETPTDDSMDDDTPTDDDSMDDDTPTDDDSMDDETESPTDGDGAGFGGAIAVGALLASLLLFYRRH
jgi:hypothetical protein